MISKMEEKCMKKRFLVSFTVWGIIVLFGLFSCKNNVDNTPNTPVVYTVIFDTNGGSEIAKQSVEDGKTVTQPPIPTKRGYDFVGWYMGNETFDFNTKIKADVTLKAKWNIITYTITYKLEGGTNSSDNPVTYNVESNDIELKNASKTGSEFCGWSNGTYIITKIAKGTTGDLTLTAKWDILVFDVSFYSDNESEPMIVKVEYGKNVTKPADPEKEEYNFAGWYKDDKMFDFSTKITEAIDLSAKWLSPGIPQANVSSYSVGDVLLNDGTVIPYNEYKLSFTDEQKKKAVGVLVVDNIGRALGWLGLNSGNKLSWAKKDSTGYNTEFSGIICTPSVDSLKLSDYLVKNIAATATFTGDIYGWDNWDYICKNDTEGTKDVLNYNSSYPAFKYMLQYSKTNKVVGKYANGWYIPSLAELCWIYRNKETINKVLSALGKSQLGGNYWSSSQFGTKYGSMGGGESFNFTGATQYFAWYVDFYNGYITIDWTGPNFERFEKKGAEHYVCCMRPLLAPPLSVSDLSAVYNLDEKTITVSWINPIDTSLDYVSLSCTKNGETIVSDIQIKDEVYILRDVESDGDEYVFTVYVVDKLNSKSSVSNTQVTTYDRLKFTSFTLPLVGYSKKGNTVTAKIVGKNFDTPDVSLDAFVVTCDGEPSIVSNTQLTRESDSVLTANFTIPDNVGNYDVTINYGMNSITSTLRVVDFSAYSVGDILLNDGTIIPYSDDNLSSLTDEQKQKVVGILYGFNDYGIPCGWLGIRNTRAKVWTGRRSKGYNTMLTDISCTPSNSDADTATFAGDTDGSDNWDYMRSVDFNGTLYSGSSFDTEEEYYPAFGYVNDYADTYGLKGDYAKGWYMPSLAELCYIYRNVSTLNKVLNALGGTQLTGDYWSSSQSSFDDMVWRVYFSKSYSYASGEIDREYKDWSSGVCCVRTFDH